MEKRQAFVHYQTRLLPALNYIRMHLADSLRLEQLAAISNFSKYHFHRVFKAVHGETVHEHVRRLRLEKAVHLLRSAREMSLAEIALATGFSSQTSLNRDFKRQFGIPPGRARRIYLGDHPCPPELALPPPSIGPSLPELGDQVRLELIESCHVLYMTRHGRYDFRLGLVWLRLMLKAHALGLLSPDSRKIGIIYDDPDITAPSRCRFDAAITIEPGRAGDGKVALRLLPAQTCAVYGYSGDIGQLGGTLDGIYLHWLVRSNYVPADAPPFMLFDGPFHDYQRFRLCIPVLQSRQDRMDRELRNIRQ